MLTTAGRRSSIARGCYANRLSSVIDRGIPDSPVGCPMRLRPRRRDGRHQRHGGGHERRVGGRSGCTDYRHTHRNGRAKAACGLGRFFCCALAASRYVLGGGEQIGIFSGQGGRHCRARDGNHQSDDHLEAGCGQRKSGDFGADRDRRHHERHDRRVARHGNGARATPGHAELPTIADTIRRRAE